MLDADYPILLSSRLSLLIHMDIHMRNIRSPLQEALELYLRSRCSTVRQARTIRIALIMHIVHISCMLLIRNNLNSSSSSHTFTLMDIRQATVRLMAMTVGLRRKEVPDSFRMADRTQVLGKHHTQASDWALDLGQEEEEERFRAMPEAQTTVERCALNVCYVLILQCALRVERRKHEEEIIRECNLCCCVTSQLVHILGLAVHKNRKKMRKIVGLEYQLCLESQHALALYPGGVATYFLGRMGSRCGGLGSVSLGDSFFL